MDRADVLEKFIDDFNNFVYFAMKDSKKVVEIFIN